MKRWGAVSAAVMMLGLLIAAGEMGGCEHFNRMGVSPDGNTIAFSLNDEGGFAVDDSSALYKLDLTTCQLTRVSGDKPLATWADINGEGDILFTWRSDDTGDCAEVALARVDGEVEDLTRNRISDVVPQWLDGERVLLATTSMIPGGEDDDEYEVVLTILENGKPRELVHEFYAESKERAYWSSLPVWSGDLLAYAAADLPKPDEEDAEEVEQEGGDENEEGMLTHIYLVSMSTGEKRELTSFTFLESDFREEDEEAQAPGYVDLAFSSDGRKLAACFLPAEFEEDQRRSWLYLIDMETSESELVKDHVNMYYPRFAPRSEGEAYRLLYLSGTGEEGEGRSVNILNLETGDSRKVLSLPGKIMTAYTDWRWLSELEGADEDAPENRLRVYHLSDLGLIVAEVNENGSDLSVRYLDGTKLRRAQLVADLRWAGERFEEVVGGSYEAWEEAVERLAEFGEQEVEFVSLEAVPRPSEEGEEE
ncbi:MAG: hypothetical protein KAX80_03675 [Planctomycetes bacterium]|nr:hypothetical protein [Planctomycetota bacterium]